MAQKGEQRKMSSQKGGNLKIFGRLNIQRELISYQTTDYVNSLQIIEWIDDFVTTLNQPTVLIMNNVRFLSV
ncbi:MAG: hypothetical protein AAF740_12900 [Bacteroidota bacterium]